MCSVVRWPARSTNSFTPQQLLFLSNSLYQRPTGWCRRGAGRAPFSMGDTGIGGAPLLSPFCTALALTYKGASYPGSICTPFWWWWWLGGAGGGGGGVAVVVVVVVVVVPETNRTARQPVSESRAHRSPAAPQGGAWRASSYRPALCPHMSEIAGIQMRWTARERPGAQRAGRRTPPRRRSTGDVRKTTGR
jgi:hypothetical protein